MLLEGSGEEYTEIAIGCQDYFRNIIEQIIAIPDDGACCTLIIYDITLPI
jgi:hypothetical protein